MLKLDPRIEKKQHEMYAILKEHNLRADNQVATSWDAGLIVVEGLRKLGPNATAAQLRDFIANLTNFAGVDGDLRFHQIPRARPRPRRLDRHHLRPGDQELEVALQAGRRAAEVREAEVWGSRSTAERPILQARGVARS